MSTGFLLMRLGDATAAPGSSSAPAVNDRPFEDGDTAPPPRELDVAPPRELDVAPPLLTVPGGRASDGGSSLLLVRRGRSSAGSSAALLDPAPVAAAAAAAALEDTWRRPDDPDGAGDADEEEEEDPVLARCLLLSRGGPLNGEAIVAGARSLTRTARRAPRRR
jgi:hypothetical protein